MDDVLITDELKAKHHYLQYLSDAQKDNADIVWKAMQPHGQFRVIEYASPRLLNDYDFMAKAVVSFGSLPYIYASSELRKNTRLILLSGKMFGINLDFAFEKSPEVFTLDFCQELIEHITHGLQEFKDLKSKEAGNEANNIALLLSKDIYVSHSSFAQHALKAIRVCHPQLITLSVAQRILEAQPLALGFLGEAVNGNYELIEKYLLQTPSLIARVHSNISKDRNLVISLINSPNGHLIELEHLNKIWQGDKELILLLIEKTHDPLKIFGYLEESLIYDMDLWRAVFSRPGINSHHKSFYTFYSALSLDYRANLIVNDSEVLSNPQLSSLNAIKNDLNADWKGMSGCMHIFERVFQDYIDTVLNIEALKRDLSDGTPEGKQATKIQNKKI